MVRLRRQRFTHNGLLLLPWQHRQGPDRPAARRCSAVLRGPRHCAADRPRGPSRMWRRHFRLQLLLRLVARAVATVVRLQWVPPRQRHVQRRQHPWRSTKTRSPPMLRSCWESTEAAAVGLVPPRRRQREGGRRVLLSLLRHRLPQRLAQQCLLPLRHRRGPPPTTPTEPRMEFLHRP